MLPAIPLERVRSMKISSSVEPSTRATRASCGVELITIWRTISECRGRMAEVLAGWIGEDRGNLVDPPTGRGRALDAENRCREIAGLDGPARPEENLDLERALATASERGDVRPRIDRAITTARMLVDAEL